MLRLLSMRLLIIYYQVGITMNKSGLALAAFALALLVTGCATPTKMAFQNDTDRLTEASKPVYLMTATIKNDYKTEYQPRLFVVNVEKEGAQDAAGRLNFLADDKSKLNEADSKDAGNSYLLRMELESGKYIIRGLTSQARALLIYGSFFTPLHSPLEVKEAGVYYLGHIAATVRERVGNEFKAGASIPLIDQAAVGASGGTFDVVITDEFATDEASFRTKFPALADVTIQKAILPAFDRAAAQQWWEAN